MPQAVRIIEPVTAPRGVVFGSPHSGRHYSDAFLASVQIDALTLRSSEDAFVDLLLADVPHQGGAMITTDVPRAYVDMNRADTELDPLLVDGAPRGGLNPRVGAGLGVVPRVVAGGRPIYADRLTLAEARHRVQTCWRPYHQELGGLLGGYRRRFGKALLFDVHSMPSDAVQSRLIRNRARPDIILGDRHGASCGPDITAAAEAVFRDAGLRVARNAPFAGAYIVQRHGQPARGQHALQIEIDRGLYLDERRITLAPDFGAFQALMSDVTAALIALGAADGGAMPLAAE